ncbi:MAG: hypothetical protein ACI867_001422, partial [Glaciecola sp.]
DARVSLHVTNEDSSQWVVVEGNALLSPVARTPGDAITTELRDLYRVLRGEHHDWDEYDRAMIADSRQVIAVRPDHAYGQLAH